MSQGGRKGWRSTRLGRGGVTLIEVLISAACLLVAGMVAMQMLSNNSTLTAWSRDALWVRERSSAVSAYWETFSFETLEALFSGHGSDPKVLEELLVPLAEVGIEPRALGLEEFREQQRFTRLMGMGVLQSRLTWRGARGSYRSHDTLKLILDDSNFQPVALPRNGAELLEQATPPPLPVVPGKSGRPGDPGDETLGNPSGPWRGPGATSPGGATSALAGDPGRRDAEAARATADQLMEMLHDLHHSGEDQAETQDLVRRVQHLASGSGVGYDWERIQGDEERAWSTDGAPRSDLDQLVGVLSAKAPPDGDYLYTYQVESDPGRDTQGRLLVLYRLVPLDGTGGSTSFLLPKLVSQDGEGQEVSVEGRPALDLGDRALQRIRLVDGGQVELAPGEWAHGEVTLKRLYLYRQRYDSSGVADPIETVLQIRSFPESLIGDGEIPSAGKELEQALRPLETVLGIGSQAEDARKRGVDTKELLGW